MLHRPLTAYLPMRRVLAAASPVSPPRGAADDAWAPRSLPRAAGAFALGYAVWQPAAQGLLHLVLGRPLPARGAGGWATFVLTVAALGAAAGAAWIGARRLRAGWWREWAESAARMVAMAALLLGPDFAVLGPIRWAAVAAGVGAGGGVLWAALGRFWAAGWRSPGPPAA